MLFLIPHLADAWTNQIKDPVIRQGVENAIEKNLLPAATERVYPGHFTINADGGGYGNDTTWPGLDSWQMAGAYLLLGKTRLVLDYFDFVRASQRKDGNIPFAIFPGNTAAGDTYLRGLKTPEDKFTYIPPRRPGLPASSQETRDWVGLYRHWELVSNPLATLGPICYILTAAEVEAATGDRNWLKGRLPSIQKTGDYLATQIAPNGLLIGSGFYTELPPRKGWDGVTQCYAVKAFRDLAALQKAAGNSFLAKVWSTRADRIARSFRAAFWRGDHFAEYIHPERGPVDSHGLSDTNWAAIAFGVADNGQTAKLWPRLIAEKRFWLGGMPTQTVADPFAYQDWESEPVPFPTAPPWHDAAAMGRSWYVESLACARMHAKSRMVESARLVSRAAQEGFWGERYVPRKDGTVHTEGTAKYCEYPAVLIRIVLGNPDTFLKG